MLHCLIYALLAILGFGSTSLYSLPKSGGHPAGHGLLRNEAREEALTKSDLDELVKISGYTYFYGFTTSRQVEGFSSDTAVYFPKKYKCDRNGEDINQKGELDFNTFATAINFDFKGPEIWGFKSSGVIEGDFFGELTTRTGLSDAINGYRMKSAYMHLEKPGTIVLIGQHYHPIGLDDVYPEVVAGNAGSPFDPFIYAPQIRVTRTAGDLEFIACVTSQTLHASRWAAFPDLYGQINLLLNENVYGVGMDYYELMPRLETARGYITRARVKPLSAHVFADIKKNRWEWKNRITYSENGDAYGMLGGYGVWRYDESTDERSYVPFRCVGWWTELVYRTEDKANEAGLFLGYIKNLGTSCPIIQTALLPVTCCDVTTEKETSLITSLFPDVDSTFRISPRVALGFSEVFTIYFEVEWTHTWWGTTSTDAILPDLTCTGRPINPQPMDNISLMVATVYKF